MAKKTTDLGQEKAQPLGDTGDGNTGVPSGEQGISNRPGDADVDDDEDDDIDEDADGDELDEGPEE